MLWFPWIESAGTKSRSSVMIVNRNSSRCYCHGVVCQDKEPEDFGICWNQPAHLLMISRGEQLWGTFHAMTLDCISSSMLCFLWSRSAACWNNNKNNNNYYNNNTCWTTSTYNLLSPLQSKHPLHQGDPGCPIWPKRLHFAHLLTLHSYSWINSIFLLGGIIPLA